MARAPMKAMAKAPMKAMVRLCTLGEAVIEIGDRRYGADAELVFACTLYLASHPGRRIPRQTLLELFWPRVPEDNRRHNLRQLIYKLRRTGIPCDADTTHVTLRAGEVFADYDSYYTPRVAESEMARVDAPFGEFLAGYTPSISPGYAEWVEHRRAEVHAQMRRVLLTSVSAFKQRGDWPEVERLARRVLAIDALNEEATLALAEATAMSGSKVAAVAMLDRYVEELGPGATEIRLPATMLKRRIGAHETSSSNEEHGPLLGREAPLAALRELLRGSQSGRGGSCLVWGEPGIGKTHLILELRNEGALAGHSIAHVPCRAAPPLSLLHSLVPRLLTQPGALGSAPSSLVLLRRFVQRAEEGEPRQESTDASFQFGLLVHSCLDLLDAVCEENPILIHVDDIHQMDSSSFAFFGELCSWASSARALVVASSRHATQTESPPELVGAHRINLGPLDDTSSQLLLSRTAEKLSVSISEERRAWCLATAGGNPFYLRELVRHVASGGATTALPPSLDLLIQSAVSALAPTARRVLQVGVVLGPLAAVERIEAILSIPRFQLLEAVDELQRTTTARFVDGVLTPQHPIVADAALKQARTSVLHVIHSCVANLLREEIRTSPSTALLWECVHHQRSCGNHSEAVDVIEECARQMLQSGLATEAAELLEDASRAEVLIANSDRLTELRIAALAKAERWTDVLAALSGHQQDGIANHGSKELLRQEALYKSDVALRPLLEQAMRCLLSDSASVEHRLRAGVRAMILADNIPDADSAFSVKTVLEGLVVGSELSHLRVRTDLMFHCHYGDLGVASSLAKDVVTQARDLGDPSSLAWALRIGSVPYRRRGDVEQASDLLLESLQIGERFRNANVVAAALDLLMSLAMEHGQLDLAQAYQARLCPFKSRVQDNILVESLTRCDYRLRLFLGSGSSLPTEIPLSPRRDCYRREAEEYAIRTGILVQHELPIPEDMLARFLIAHEKTRRYCAQDGITNFLVGALRASGRSNEASKTVAEYQATYRRETFPMWVSPIASLGGFPLLA